MSDNPDASGIRVFLIFRTQIELGKPTGFPILVAGENPTGADFQGLKNFSPPCG